MSGVSDQAMNGWAPWRVSQWCSCWFPLASLGGVATISRTVSDSSGEMKVSQKSLPTAPAAGIEHHHHEIGGVEDRVGEAALLLQGVLDAPPLGGLEADRREVGDRGG